MAALLKDDKAPIGVEIDRVTNTKSIRRERVVNIFMSYPLFCSIPVNIIFSNSLLTDCGKFLFP